MKAYFYHIEGQNNNITSPCVQYTFHSCLQESLSMDNQTKGKLDLLEVLWSDSAESILKVLSSIYVFSKFFVEIKSV